MLNSARDIDALVFEAHFGSPAEQVRAFQTIRALAEAQGARPASLHHLYRARGKGYIPSTFTVPAFNLRGLSYLTAQAAFEAAKKHHVGLVIFELARSEMKYTAQTSAMLASSVLGAAVKTGWTNPVFLQGDHYQPKAASPGQMVDGELMSIADLIRDSLAAGFYNIDIDGSTLVDARQPTEYDQQRSNFLYTTQLIQFIRSLQPANVMVSIGCEIAEVGTHLSKSSQLSAFMTGFRDEGGHDLEGPSKVAIETGTKHGGVVNPDGSPGEMFVDFDRLKTISILARHKYQMAGAVQHGASTLSKDVFTRFPEAETAEIHLSTGFQNTIFNHSAFPQTLINHIYAWCEENCAAERKPEWTAAQFYSKTRKKAWGPFKREIWNLPQATQQAIKETLQAECETYYQSLNVANTVHLVKEWT